MFPVLVKSHFAEAFSTAFQTAVALASFEAKKNGDEVPELKTDHIDQVVKMSKNFKVYMEQALQVTYDEWAAMNRLRALDSQPDLPPPSQFQVPKSFAR